MINYPFPPVNNNNNNNNNNNRKTNFSKSSKVSTKGDENLFIIGALLQPFSVALFSLLCAPTDSMFCNGAGIARTGEGKRDESLIGTLVGALSTSAK